MRYLDLTKVLNITYILTILLISTYSYSNKTSIENFKTYEWGISNTTLINRVTKQEITELINNLPIDILELLTTDFSIRENTTNSQIKNIKLVTAKPLSYGKIDNSTPFNLQNNSADRYLPVRFTIKTFNQKIKGHNAFFTNGMILEVLDIKYKIANIAKVNYWHDLKSSKLNRDKTQSTIIGNKLYLIGDLFLSRKTDSGDCFVYNLDNTHLG